MNVDNVNDDDAYSFHLLQWSLIILLSATLRYFITRQNLIPPFPRWSNL